VAIVLGLVGMLAFYVEHTALDEDGFETISRNMIENDEIRTQVAAKSVDTLFENVDVEAAITERLPPAQQGLAPVLAGLARSANPDDWSIAMPNEHVHVPGEEVSAGSALAVSYRARCQFVKQQTAGVPRGVELNRRRTCRSEGTL
jgi:hypothetical protein